MSSIGIYKITNQINGKCYIGKSKKIEDRFYAHKSRYLNEKESNKLLYKAFKKYGLNNFSFEIIEECEENLLDEREKYWISYYDSYKKGYNATFGGDGGITVSDPRAVYGKLTSKEVEYLRLRYAECKYPASYIYEMEFKNKITKRGFQAIWLGQNGKDILPEVFTKENKQKQLQLGRAYEGVLRRRVSLKEKEKIRERIKQGEKCGTIWRKEYQHLYKSATGFRDMVNGKSLDEEIILDGKTKLDPLQV